MHSSGAWLKTENRFEEILGQLQDLPAEVSRQGPYERAPVLTAMRPLSGRRGSLLCQGHPAKHVYSDEFGRFGPVQHRIRYGTSGPHHIG